MPFSSVYCIEDKHSKEILLKQVSLTTTQCLRIILYQFGDEGNWSQQTCTCNGVGQKASGTGSTKASEGNLQDIKSTNDRISWVATDI